MLGRGRAAARGRARRAILLAALLIVVGPPAQAQRAEVFAVKNVAVDATADTTTEAKDLAIAQGRPIAYRLMLEKLTLREDHGRLPEFNPDRADDLIIGFRVESEKTSAVRYLGRLTYVFDPPAVRALLRTAGLRFAETTSKPSVVLPVYYDAGTSRLWEDPNPWRDAWSEAPMTGGLAPLMLPLGDLADIADVDVQAAVNGDAERLARLADRYGAKESLVAELRTDTDRVQVLVRRYGLTETGTVAASHTGPIGDDLPAALARAAAAVADQLNETWKQRNLLGFRGRSTLVALVPFSDLREWITVSQRLRAVAPVRGTRTIKLARRARELELQFVGEVDQLVLAMEQADLVLEQSQPAEIGTTDPDEDATAAASQSEARWVIRLRSAQPETSPAAGPPAAQEPGTTEGEPADPDAALGQNSSQDPADQ